MAAVNDTFVPLVAETPPATGLDAAGLQAVALAFGMDPNSKNELLKPDENFLQEAVKVPVSFAGMPSGTDVQGMRKWVHDTFSNETLVQHRAKFEFRRRRPKQDISKQIITVKATDGKSDFALWIYEPPPLTGRQSSSRPAILMLHGGGWIHGNPSGDEDLALLFSSELDAVVIGIDYRLAPEHQFPAPLDDCSDSIDWVFQHASLYNIDINRLGLWGASAGGNLAAALALRYTEAQLTTQRPGLRLVSLAVPVTAHPVANDIFDKQRAFPLSQNEMLFAGASAPPEAAIDEFVKLYELYTGEAADLCDPLVSPLMAQPSTRHPPTYITVAGCDSLRAQGQAYAELLRLSGVSVVEDILPGVPHMFTLPTNSTVTRDWTARQVEGFAKAFGIVVT